MPALSPTMSQGNIAKWQVKVGDEVKAGTILAEVETDKATLGFENQDDGYVAKLLVPDGAKDVPVGQPVAVLVEDASAIPAFANYSAAGASAPSTSAPAAAPAAAPGPKPAAPKPAAPAKQYPAHTVSASRAAHAYAACCMGACPRLAAAVPVSSRFMHACIMRGWCVMHGGAWRMQAFLSPGAAMCVRTPSAWAASRTHATQLIPSPVLPAAPCPAWPHPPVT